MKYVIRNSSLADNCIFYKEIVEHIISGSPNLKRAGKQRHRYTKRSAEVIKSKRLNINRELSLRIAMSPLSGTCMSSMAKESNADIIINKDREKCWMFISIEII